MKNASLKLCLAWAGSFVSVLVTLSVALALPSAAAQQFSINPANPLLLGEPVAISLSGLPADEDVKITAERVMAEWRNESGNNKRALALKVPALVEALSRLIRGACSGQ